jgi:RNA polymerase sigma-70 factor (ECF subfamily)
MLYSNSKIVRLCIEGNPRGWEKFIERFSGLLLWALNDRLAKSNFRVQEQEIEDILQELLISIWRENKLAQIKDVKKIKSWLCIVAQRRAIDYIRKKRANEVSIFDPKEGLALKDTLPADGPGPLEEYIAQETHQAVASAIERLAPREKIIIELNLLYGKKYREIAQILRLPVGSVATIIMRAKEKIKTSLENADF